MKVNQSVQWISSTVVHSTLASMGSQSELSTSSRGADIAVIPAIDISIERTIRFLGMFVKANIEPNMNPIVFNSAKSWPRSDSSSVPTKAFRCRLSCIVMDGFGYWASTHFSFHLLSDVTRKKGFRTSSTKS